MKTFVVIGLGRFGTALATELCALGHEVLVIDHREENVHTVADLVTHAVMGDARDFSVLKSLGVRNYDCGIVATGDDIGTSALITLNLKELGLKQVVCKAQSHVHRKVLERIGADKVVFPEHETGVRLAQALSNSNILNYIELSDDYGIVEIGAPKGWPGNSIRALDVRVKHRVNIIAVRSASGELIVSPASDYVVKNNDTIVTLGLIDDINRLHELT